MNGLNLITKNINFLKKKFTVYKIFKRNNKKLKKINLMT